MKLPTYQTNKDFVLATLKIVFLAGSIGIALKFLTFQIILNQNLYSGAVLNTVVFPYFPNVLDSVFLVASVSYFFYLSRKKPTTYG